MCAPPAWCLLLGIFIAKFKDRICTLYLLPAEVGEIQSALLFLNAFCIYKRTFLIICSRPTQCMAVFVVGM